MQERARRIDQAQKDLADIQALRASEPWKRYYEPKLTRWRDNAGKSALVDEMGIEKREAMRQRFLAFNEVVDVLDKDEASAKKLLSDPSNQ